MRRELGVRTIFNALGPLANPAGATRQLIGVGRPELVRAARGRARRRSARERAIVFHSENGLDELVPGVAAVGRRGRGTAGRGPGGSIPPTLRAGAGRARASSRAATRRRTPRCCARLLEGEPGPRREAVLLNAARGARRRGARGRTCADGYERARASIDSGAAARGRFADGCKEAVAGAGMSDVLTQILAAKHDAALARRVRAARRRRRAPDGRRAVRRRRCASPAPGSSRRSRRRSPSAGRDPARTPTARSRASRCCYRRGHAAAISVVTEQDHFGGEPDWLPRAKSDLGPAGAHEGLHRRRAAARLRGRRSGPTRCS